MRILVTGATGYAGSRLVTALLADHHQVTAASRNPVRLKRLGWSGDVAPVTLDASDPASAHAALAAAGPVDVVYYLVHAIGQTGFRDADKTAAANVAAAARDAGVRRIVYLGGLVPDDDALSEHLASGAEVAAALTVHGGPEVVWLGAAMILGADSASFETLRYVGDRFPLIPIPAWMNNPIDPISIRDVLHYLVAGADTARVPAGAYDICGPHATSYRALLQTYGRISGRWPAGLRVGGSMPVWRPWSRQLRCRFLKGWPRTWWSRWTTRWLRPTPSCVTWFPTRPVVCSPSTRPSRGRWRALRHDLSTRWPTRIILPTVMPCELAATPCASGGSPRRSPRPSRGRAWGW